ncbi:AAEL009226-PA [Aedes aegypti]|uniref:AAEL009226-PA n=2 Tax=Aedes aegypti TaxID=7159 RepID=Q16WH7_AEDAE|nr:putative salivary mucin [Aedes aegypti]EAT38920.1 AAEL009226-PA [Aedes aegypti]
MLLYLRYPVVFLLTLLPLKASTDSRCPANPSQTVHLPNPTDCGKFLTCVWGNTVQQSCPAGLHWNARLQVCDWPANTYCASEHVLSSTRKPPVPNCDRSHLCTIAEQMGLDCSSIVLGSSNDGSCQ